MKKFTIADLQKALEYLKKTCYAEFVVFEFDERERLLLKASDLAGDMLTITIFDEATAKMPTITRTERL